MTFLLSKRKIGIDGPYHTPIESFETFNEAWNEAVRLFESTGLNIVGCHLQPEFPHHAAYAEFFVVALPDVHETYVISEAQA